MIFTKTIKDLHSPIRNSVSRRGFVSRKRGIGDEGFSECCGYEFCRVLVRCHVVLPRSVFMEGVSLSTLATCGKSRLYGSSPFWMAPFEPFKRSHSNFANAKHLISNQCVQSLFSIRYPFMSRQSDVKAEAAWMFRWGEPGLDASAGQSESANEDILMFFFQLDIAIRVQYALNIEEYDIAQQLQNKLTECLWKVEEELIKQQQSKRGMSAKSEAQDKALSIIRLHSDLQIAIENEDYSLAAELRDEISKLEAESLAASAKALAHVNAQYVFRLGQKVRHKFFEYC